MERWGRLSTQESESNGPLHPHGLLVDPREWSPLHLERMDVRVSKMKSPPRVKREAGSSLAC